MGEQDTVLCIPDPLAEQHMEVAAVGQRNISIQREETPAEAVRAGGKGDGPPMSPAPCGELMMHFSLAATGGQPEGGSRPPTSPKKWGWRAQVKQQERSRGEWAAGKLL